MFGRASVMFIRENADSGGNRVYRVAQRSDGKSGRKKFGRRFPGGGGGILRRFDGKGGVRHSPTALRPRGFWPETGISSEDDDGVLPGHRYGITGYRTIEGHEPSPMAHGQGQEVSIRQLLWSMDPFGLEDMVVENADIIGPKLMDLSTDSGAPPTGRMQFIRLQNTGLLQPHFLTGRIPSGGVGR